MVEVEIRDIPPRELPPVIGVDFFGGRPGIILRGAAARRRFASIRSRRARAKAETQKLRNQRVKDLEQEKFKLLAVAREELFKDIRTLSRQDKLNRRQLFAEQVSQITANFVNQRTSVQSASLPSLKSQSFKIAQPKVEPTDTRKELPFEQFTRVTGETAGKLTREGLERIPGVRDVRVTTGGQEIPLKQTISTDTTGKVFFPKTDQPFSEAAGLTVQQTVAIGQFLIPVVGQTLFLSTLLERPILAPDEFKKEFAENPVKTAALFGLGLLSIRGGIKSGLTAREQRLVNQELKTAKTSFFATADDETINILSKINVRGKPFVTRTQAQILSKSGKREITREGSLTIRQISKNKVEGLISEAVSESRAAGTARLRRKIVSPDKAKLKFSEIEELRGSPFLVQTGQLDRLRVIFNTKKGFNIRNGEVVFLGKAVEIERVPLAVIKRQTVGVVTPTEVESLFKVFGGSPRLRIYKAGGISYVFNPRISGWLKILPSKSFSGSGKTILLRRVQTAAGSAVAAAEAGLKGVVAKESARLGVRAKVLKRTAKATTTIGGSQTLQSVKVQGQTLGGTQSLSVIQKQRSVPLTGFALATGQSTAQRQELIVKTKLSQLTKVIPRTAVGQQFKLRQQLRLRTKLKTIQQQRARARAGLGPRSRITARPKLPVPFGATSGKRGSKPFAGTVKKQPGFNTLIRRGGKFSKVNKNPLTKQRARSLGAFVSDQSLAATFKIQKAKGQAKKSVFRFPKDYFRRTVNKFRPAKRGSGIVEKRKFRLDTIRERRKIQAARLLAKIRKPFRKRL